MVEIHLGLHPKDSRIIIDGHDMTNRITGIKINQTARTLSTVELQLVSDEIKITGDAILLRDKELGFYSDEELKEELAKRLIKVEK